MPSVLHGFWSMECSIPGTDKPALFLVLPFFFFAVCVGEHPCAVMLVGPIRGDRVGPGTWIGGGQ